MKPSPIAGHGPKFAMSLAEFCSEFGTSRSAAYREIQAGRLIVRKAGRRTIVLGEDAMRWARSLPVYPSKAEADVPLHPISAAAGRVVDRHPRGRE